jgi:hypothetical protein
MVMRMDGGAGEAVKLFVVNLTGGAAAWDGTHPR